jgi:hypothetical protein
MIYPTSRGFDIKSSEFDVDNSYGSSSSFLSADENVCTTTEAQHADFATLTIKDSELFFRMMREIFVVVPSKKSRHMDRTTTHVDEGGSDREITHLYERQKEEAGNKLTYKPVCVLDLLGNRDNYPRFTRNMELSGFSRECIEAALSEKIIHHVSEVVVRLKNYSKENLSVARELLYRSAKTYSEDVKDVGHWLLSNMARQKQIMTEMKQFEKKNDYIKNLYTTYLSPRSDFAAASRSDLVDTWKKEQSP